MDIQCYNSQTLVPISIDQVKCLVISFLEMKEVQTDEVVIHFVDKKAISKLHNDFFDDPSPTDCISFPIDSPLEYSSNNHHILGEIFVCPEVALEYSQEHKLDLYKEISLYVMHGLLHLLGYNDLDPTDEKLMREEEAKGLKYMEEINLMLSIYSS